MRRNPRAGSLQSGGFRLPVFTPDELAEIHRATLEVMAHTGVFVQSAEAREMFCRAGASADSDTGVVKIPAYLVEEAIDSAPEKIVLRGRTPDKDVVLEGGRVGFTNFGEAIKVFDRETGELRETLKKDVADMALMVDALDVIDVLERPAGSHDAPSEVAALHNYEAMVTNCTKHSVIGPFDSYQALKILEMARAVIRGVYGEAEASRRLPVSFLTCPVSPLRLVKDCCDIIMTAAANDACVCVLSMAMSGGSSPVNLAGTLVTHNTEVLAGITLAQLVKKGAPVIYGSSTTAMDLRQAAAAVGSPELGMINAAVAAISRYYLLPSWVAGG